MEKKYIAIEDAIVMWIDIVSNGPIDKLPHIRKIVNATVNKHSIKDLNILVRALISICEINETHEFNCGSYYCDTCEKRKSIHRSLKNYISKLKTIIENE